MSLKPITVLRRARKLITDPKRWIKGAFTRKVKRVQCYCGLGAIAKAAGVKIKSEQHLSNELRLPDEYYAAHALLNRAAHFACFFASYNDREDVTHADVLAVFDRAIELAKDA